MENLSTVNFQFLLSDDTFSLDNEQYLVVHTSSKSPHVVTSLKIANIANMEEIYLLYEMHVNGKLLYHDFSICV